jgi:multidrug efflux pump
VSASLLLAAGAYALLEVIPQEYAPAEDQGTFMGQIQAPEGASFERVAREALAVEEPLRPYFESGLVQRGIVGVPGWGNQGAGIINVTLVPWDQRETTTAELLAELNARWAEIPDLQVTAYMRSSAPGGGRNGGGGGQPVQIVIGGPNYQELAEWRDLIITRAAENPGLQRLDSDLKETQPQVLLRIDTDRAASLGVSAESIGRTLQSVMSERRISTYVVDGEEYDVVLQAEADQRASYADLRSVFVRSERSGELIPLSNLTTLEDQAGPAQLNRYNRTRAVTISANLAPDYTLGEALDFLENVIRTELPATARIDYRGESRALRDSLIIMITVPLAVAGGLFGLWVAGLTLNIYSQIGIIMLVGIAAKNGVLIVEFINQMRDEGREFRDAVIEGSRIRFRPVVMTAFSTVMGSIPLIMATGPGAVSRMNLGVVIFAGVSIATLFTLFIVPAFYDVFARRTNSPNAVARRLKSMRSRVAG